MPDRWRRVTLAGEDGHLITGWAPAAVTDRVGTLVRIAGLTPRSIRRWPR
jgi:hypothetical protein